MSFSEMGFGVVHIDVESGTATVVDTVEEFQAAIDGEEVEQDG